MVKSGVFIDPELRYSREAKGQVVVGGQVFRYDVVQKGSGVVYMKLKDEKGETSWVWSTAYAEKWKDKLNSYKSATAKLFIRKNTASFIKKAKNGRFYFVFADAPRLDLYIKEARRIFRGDLGHLKRDDAFTPLMSLEGIMALIGPEVMSKDFIIKHADNKRLLAAAYLSFTVLPLNVFASRDSWLSYGAFQERKQTIERLFKSPTYKGIIGRENTLTFTVSFSNQFRLTLLLAYDNLHNLYNYLKRKPVFNKFWSRLKGRDDEKRVVVLWLMAAMHNMGYTSHFISRVALPAIEEAASSPHPFTPFKRAFLRHLGETTKDTQTYALSVYYMEQAIKATDVLKWVSPRRRYRQHLREEAVTH